MATASPSNDQNSPTMEPTHEDDNVSTTLTIQSGFSANYRTGDASRLGRHGVKIKSSSSFPNLLSLYQEPIREESNLDGTHTASQQVRVKRGKPKRRRKVQTDKIDWEDAHEKRQRSEMRQVRVDTVAKEQLEKFDNYVSSMRAKVEKQREERKKYNELLQERLREQEEAERKKLRLHRGPKHKYVHDKTYMKALPVSNYCKSIRLADDLQRKGILRTRYDVDKFWAGHGHKAENDVDIFSANTANSVNYPQHWIGMKKPEIRVTSGTDSDVTETRMNHRRTQLPSIKQRVRVA